MFDPEVYLHRIGCADLRGTGIDALRTLHKRHLMAIPYNSGTPLAGAYTDGRDGVGLVTVDEDAVFDGSVVRGGGGVCFHLNRLFVRLLRHLGFDARLLAAGTAEGREYLGTDIDHMFILASVDGKDWLVDVGYPGPSYIEPLLLREGTQTQYGCRYRITADGDQLELARRGRTTRWSQVYRFRPRPRDPADWLDLEEKLRVRSAAADPGDGDTVLCGRTLDDGQVVLKGRRHLVVRDGRERVRTLVDDAEFHDTISRILTGAPKAAPTANSGK